VTKFYQTLNQPPRSMKHHGKHRRPNPPAHRSALDRTDHGAGGATTGVTTFTFSTVNSWVSWDIARADPEPPSPPTIPDAGIRAGEIIGHRLWWVIREKGDEWLCSLAHRQLWQPGETIHGDTLKPVGNWQWHSKPVFGGTYAFALPDHIEPELAEWQKAIAMMGDARNVIWVGGIDWDPLYETRTLVAGTVKMWSDVVEHERGYRAEFAKINSLDAAYGDCDLEMLRRKYRLTSA
jgi:hypothetical protein